MMQMQMKMQMQVNMGTIPMGRGTPRKIFQEILELKYKSDGAIYRCLGYQEGRQNGG